MAGPQGAKRRDKENGKREDDQHDGERDGAVEVGLERRIDGEWHRLRAPHQVAGERDRGAELTKRTGPRHGGAGEHGRQRDRQQHVPERVHGRCAQRHCDIAIARLDFSQASYHGRDEERRRDEQQCNNNRERGKRQRDPEESEHATGESGASEGKKEAHAGDGGRQYDRQLDEHFDQPLAAKVAHRQQVGHRQPERHHRERGEDTGEQRQLERGDDDRLLYVDPELGRRHVQQQRHDGQRQQHHEQGHRHRHGDLQQHSAPGRRRQRTARAGMKPFRASTAWPVGESSRSTKARAAPGLVLRRSTVTG